MYEWVKALHVISIICWMAGLLYLPRLMIYHMDAEVDSVQSETFKVMEHRLLKIIMGPAMMASWVFGLWLVYITSAYQTGWFVAKFFLVIVLTATHIFQGKWVKDFAQDRRVRSAKFYRFANEGPTLLMIFIVILAVVKPF